MKRSTHRRHDATPGEIAAFLAGSLMLSLVLAAVAIMMLIEVVS